MFVLRVLDSAKARKCKTSIKIGFWPTFLVALFATTTAVFAQSSRHYNMQVGCPFTTAKDIPDSMTLDELNKDCSLNEIRPRAPEHTVAVLTSGATKPEPTPFSAKASATDTRQFRAFDGRDVEGQDLRRIENTTLKRCVQACRGNSDCTAISFDKWNNYCFLKRSVSKGLRVEPKAIVIVSSSLTPGNNESPTVIERFRKRRFLTHPYSTAVAKSFEACSSSCDRDRQCEVFTYGKANRSCSLIAKPDEWFADPDFDSGIKRQSASR